MIHLVFWSKTFSTSKLFLSLHVSCERICPTPRANYSSSQDFFFLLCPIFLYANTTPPKKWCLFPLCLSRPTTESSLLSLGEKKPNAIWSEFSPRLGPPSLQRWEQTVPGAHLFWRLQRCFRPVLIIRRTRVQPNRYPLSFISHFVFSSLWEAGQVNVSPDDGDWDAGDPDGASRFSNT